MFKTKIDYKNSHLRITDCARKLGRPRLKECMIRDARIIEL